MQQLSGFLKSKTDLQLTFDAEITCLCSAVVAFGHMKWRLSGTEIGAKK